MTEHKLLHKSNKFILTSHRSKYYIYYRIEVTGIQKLYATETDIETYSEHFKLNTHRSGNGWWEYTDEEHAKSLYNWAVLKWNDDVT